jgi:hypothetical protein
VHVTPVARRFIETMAAASPFPTSTILRGLLDPRLTERMLDLLRSKGRVFDPVLHNTVNATIVRGGEKINVIPSEVTVELDGRLLPGYTPPIRPGRYPGSPLVPGHYGRTILLAAGHPDLRLSADEAARRLQRFTDYPRRG